MRGARVEGGFSLIELLVVVLIIGLGIAIVGISVGNNRPQALRADAHTFANLTTEVQAEAVLSRQPWGLQIYRELIDGDECIAYRWLRFAGDEHGWQPDAPADMPPGGHFAADVTAVLEVEGQEQLIEPLPKDKPASPTVWLAPGGEMTPFVLHLHFSGEEGGPVVRADALGHVELELQGDDEQQ